MDSIARGAESGANEEKDLWGMWAMIENFLNHNLERFRSFIPLATLVPFRMTASS
ncbi:MAG: hypothetical protein JJU46_02960 [Balneolaceae bacterium]|nr:hypothetical protein [Balneolaceae bacterium]